MKKTSVEICANCGKVSKDPIEDFLCSNCGGVVAVVVPHEIFLTMIKNNIAKK